MEQRSIFSTFVEAGPLIGVVLIVLVCIFAGYKYWKTRKNQ